MQFVIETARLVLRKFVIYDSFDVMKMSLEPHAKKWLSNQVCETLKESEDLLNSLIKSYERVEFPIHHTVVLGIENKETGSLIGHVGLSPFQDFMEIGYGVSEKSLNKGFATEAVSAFSDYILMSGGLKTIFAVVDSDNLASRCVLEKSGFSHFETRPGEAFGKQHNCFIYAKQLDSMSFVRKGRK